MEVENGFEIVDCKTDSNGALDSDISDPVNQSSDSASKRTEDAKVTDVPNKHNTDEPASGRRDPSADGMKPSDLPEDLTPRLTRQESIRKAARFAREHDIEKETLFEKMVHAILAVLCFLAILIILPFFLPISLIFRIYRHTLLFVIGRRERKVDVVNGSDSVWLQDSADNPAVINSLLVVKGRPDIRPFQERITETMVDARAEGSDRRLLPKVKQYTSTIYRRYVWIDEERFDIDDHMYVHPEPAPKSTEELQAMVSRICSTPLACTGKAAWQFILLKYAETPEGETPDHQTFYIVFRVHHSIADGISLVKLLVHKMVDKVPDEMLQAPKRFGGSRGVLSKVLKAVFEGPVLLVERLLWPADHHVLHTAQALSGRKLVAWSDPLDLALVKQMKNATGTTVNDVVVSCLAGAFGEYFRKYASVIPKEVKAYVPVDTRPSSQKELILDNEFALVFLALPVNVTDPLETLYRVKSRMDRIKTSPEPIITSLVIKYAMARLPNWLTRLSFDWLSDKCTLVLSNVPGPQEKLTMVGQELDDMLFWPPQRSTVGLGVSIFSYGGHVRIGVLVDKTLCTNPNLLVKEFVNKAYQLADQLKIS